MIVKMKNAGRSMRRRGNALYESIYNATIELIKKVGYINLTFQEIAKAAKTSRTVIYRRWQTKLDLIHEIMVYKMKKVLDGELIDKIEDTGSLRGDLLQLLTLYNKAYLEVGPEIMNAILFEMGQNNKKMTEITVNATNKNILVMQKLLGFAKARGEKIKEVSETTLTLPFDLIRVEYLMRKGVIHEKRLELLVDEILLPVFLA
ncbi:TetR/AcrR family transcriptional regulator [Heyndrickxia coagulans]|jgi:AcrR family transcriptional regulator|uniref:TetR/AcrR family transcriptional regulator n=2 Tax=Heyndrickxia TaxID=2837504 RepID=UPI0021B446B7|nr:TetR/AcrR family transcriptional regulator [Heyndrickxia coagulans]UXC22792.1 TetR/AcrR family transcriptional regulator [Heyndrickxia coagulans]